MKKLTVTEHLNQSENRFLTFLEMLENGEVSIEANDYIMEREIPTLQAWIIQNIKNYDFFALEKAIQKYIPKIATMTSDEVLLIRRELFDNGNELNKLHVVGKNYNETIGNLNQRKKAVYCARLYLFLSNEFGINPMRLRKKSIYNATGVNEIVLKGTMRLNYHNNNWYYNGISKEIMLGLPHKKKTK